GSEATSCAIESLNWAGKCAIRKMAKNSRRVSRLDWGAQAERVVAGSRAGNIFDHASRIGFQFPVSASCRDLQAGSLCSPKKHPCAIQKNALATNGCIRHLED